MTRATANPAAPGAEPAAKRAAARAACLNCGAPLGAIQPRFCPACGQETRLKPPTVGEFLQQLGGAYFSTEGALWRTLKLLLFKPGELTRQYLDGRRKHYVLPLRLYLTISVFTLLLMRALALFDAGGEAVVVTQALTERRNLSFTLFGDSKAGLKDGVFFCTQLPPWVCRRVERLVHVDPQAMNTEWERLRERFVANLGLAMFVMLPCFALGMKLVYLNRRLRYTEHLIFALHVHAFWFVALALMLFNNTWLSLAAGLVLPYYSLAAMRRVYGGRRWPRLLRAALVATLYSMVLILALTGVAFWAFLI